MKYYICVKIEGIISGEPKFEINRIYNSNDSEFINQFSADSVTVNHHEVYYDFKKCDESGAYYKHGDYSGIAGFLHDTSKDYLEQIERGRSFLDKIIEENENKAYDTEKQPPKYTDWAELVLDAYCN